ncbi:MAG: hypothetical protein DMG02_26105 [Acidobacteria bacterium]|nr:MAG: hypothetical protein DMG02_26105 [Acidobacteriota bacterium]PYR04357.1 MAG: hypothetical protein DMF99_32095 [Acidobacteriota bacterium]
MCLDFVIPLNERHIRSVLREWVAHYNRGRPQASLEPGIPDPPHDCSRHLRMVIGFVTAVASSPNQCPLPKLDRLR